MRRSSRREDLYWSHRKALRVWPVPGPDLDQGMKDFLSSKLGFSSLEIQDVTPSNIIKYIDPRSKVKNEVIATFPSTGVRDMVKAAAPKLAGFGRDAGIQLHIPGYLMSNFKLLENLGYRMRAANSDVRRVIKYDDENLNLMMDVRIDGNWRRVQPADAEAAKVALGNDVPLSSGPSPMTGLHIMDFFTGTPATGANATPTQ